MVGHWSFDGDAKDRTPYVNHGTVNGATLVADRLGNGASAYSFNGAGNYITIPDDEILEPTNITAAAWVKLDTPLSSQPAGYPGIISKRSNKNGYAMYFFSGQQKIQVSIGDGATQAVSQASVAGYDWTKWHHVGFSYDGTAVKIFVDGQVVSETPQAVALSGAATDLWFGDITDFTGSYLQGSLDDVRVYSRALGTDEIAGLHEKYRPVIQMSDLNKGLVGHWAFSAGFEAKDLTPYSNHGTVSGATLTADRHGAAQAAYSFDGIDDNIRSTNDNYTHSGEYSIGMWVKTSTADGITRAMCGFHSGSGSNANQLFVGENGNLNFRAFDHDTGVKILTSPASIADGQWHYVFATGESNASVKLYLDGVLQDTVSVGDPEGFLTTFTIGTAYEPISYLFPSPNQVFSERKSFSGRRRSHSYVAECWSFCSRKRLVWGWKGDMKWVLWV